MNQLTVEICGRALRPVLVGAALLFTGTTLYAASAEPIRESTIRAHMEFLAGDALNGRGSGTRDEWVSATYIGSELRRMGLKPLTEGGDFVQTVEIDRTEAIGTASIKIGDLTLRQGEGVLMLRLAQGTVNSTLVKFHRGTKAPAGATVLMPENAPRGIPQEAEDASLVLFKESAPIHERWNELSHRPIVVGAPRVAGLGRAEEPPEPRLAQMFLTADAYAMVERLPNSVPVNLTLETREVIAHTWNAVGLLPGAERDSIVLLSAHLDHLGTRETGTDKIFNGADDDASGCAAVLALAEALAQGPTPKRTVAFAFFGSEEAGGYGARYFVQKPVLPLSDIAANLEFEMIGRSDPSIAAHTLWLTGWERSNLGPELAAHGAHLVADPHPAENFFARSDNITLARKGVVAQTVSSYGLHSDYHQPTDDLSRIDFAHLTESVRSMVAPIRWLIDSEFTPAWLPGRKP